MDIIKPGKNSIHSAKLHSVTKTRCEQCILVADVTILLQFLKYGVICLFEVNKYYCCIMTLIRVKIPVTFTIQQARNDRVQQSKPRRLGKKKFASVKVVIKLTVKHLFKNPASKRQN